MDSPVIGEKLSPEFMDEIAEAIEQRQRNFPNEPFKFTLFFVLDNIGNQHAKVICSGPEGWTCLKREVPNIVDIPEEGPILCPEGHTIDSLPPLELGWVMPA